ncbi:MAG: DNA repair protein RadA [Bacillota bacterium]|nr:DNA repair protein RadA [Bacillota bacterium]MDW7683354.1 DNA repair protein RadA [Bacillota bacterium]
MAKGKTVYFCVECGYESPKWLGKCPGCGVWNRMEEELRTPAKGRSRPDVRPKATLLGELNNEDSLRFVTGSTELDRVLGGGVVPGSLVLIGGDPGIGKSTLVLQAAQGLGQTGKKVLYIAGEESPAQLSMRARRLQVDTANLLVLAETDMDVIEEQVLAVRPDVVVVDSIQTVYRPELPSAAGSVSQLKEATAAWMRLAKGQNIAVFLIGHVTKEGQIAGPRLLEHMVDCVLYFEGDRQHLYRILRAVKNRFGSTHEIGLFTMGTTGLAEVANPSEWLLSQRPADAAGSVVTASIEGTRPLLLEIQALVSPTRYGNPRRTATGVDLNRVALILAVLEKHAGLHILDYDVFVNAAGGVRLSEPAVDLAVAASLVSSFRDTPFAVDTIFLGEIGLAGEVRGIPHLEQRLHEGARLGFKRAVVPKFSLAGLRDRAGMELFGVSALHEAFDPGRV